MIEIGFHGDKYISTISYNKIGGNYIYTIHTSEPWVGIRDIKEEFTKTTKKENSVKRIQLTISHGMHDKNYNVIAFSGWDFMLTEQRKYCIMVMLLDKEVIHKKTEHFINDLKYIPIK